MATNSKPDPLQAFPNDNEIVAHSIVIVQNYADVLGGPLVDHEKDYEVKSNVPLKISGLASPAGAYVKGLVPNTASVSGFVTATNGVWNNMSLPIDGLNNGTEYTLEIQTRRLSTDTVYSTTLRKIKVVA